MAESATAQILPSRAVGVPSTSQGRGVGGEGRLNRRKRRSTTGDNVNESTRTIELDPVSHDYVTLAFGIERHVPGFVDAYFGPDEVKQAVTDGELPEPSDLLARARDLQRRIEGG